MSVETIVWRKNCVRIIDQTKLPGQLVYIDCKDTETLWHAIKRLSVRGAPALGIAAGFGVLLGMKEFKGKGIEAFITHIHAICDYLGTSRPTAVNLFNVLNRMRDVADSDRFSSIAQLKVALKKEAMAVYEEDRLVCRKMGTFGSRLIRNDGNYMTICNAGALATADYGTALGVFYSAKDDEKKFKVFSCETRPLLQGARLSTWEMLKNGIDVTLICDNMAACVMRDKKIQGIFAGADRIASNGDTANKVGTYGLAVLAKHHNIPFYIVAPSSTFDLNIKDGSQIPIEERSEEEVKTFAGIRTAPEKVNAYNPAFDVTPNDLITAIITEHGIIKSPFTANIKKFIGRN